MILCSDMIERGRIARRKGFRRWEDNPIQPPAGPVREMGYHGPHPIGLVRVDIDYHQLFDIGWQIEECLPYEGPEMNPDWFVK